MNFGRVVLALTATLSLVASGLALAANSGAPTGPTQQLIVTDAYNTPILTYTGFNSPACNAAGFTVTATGNDAANGFIDVTDPITLNGTLVTTQNFSLGPGPFTFPTSFSNPNAPGPPPYTYVYNLQVRQTGNFLGTSVVTVTCSAGGVATATNVWVAASSIPTMSEWGIALLALVIGAAAIVLFRRQSAARR